MYLLMQDLRYALRMMRKAPGFTAIAVVTLALGIGANTAIFSVVNAFFLRLLPFDNPAQLVHVWGTVRRGEAADERRVSPANFLDWQRRARSFEQLGAYYYTEVNVATSEAPVRVQLGRVTASITSLLGAQPILGRGFTAEEAQAGRGKVVLLSDSYWRRHFGADPHVVGQTLRVDGESYSVVGVMPPSFVFPMKATQLWAPLAISGDEAQRGDGSLLVVGRLKPGVSMKAAQADMNNVAAQLAQEYAVDKDTGARIVPLGSALLFFHDQIVLLMLALLLAAVFVLLIVCSNLGTLLVARAIDRSREVAIRTALGATRTRVVRQLLTESTLLAVMGGGLGFWLAAPIASLLEAKLPPDLYRVGTISLDAHVLAFTAVVSLLTVLLFGLAPALMISRPQASEMLKEGGRVAGGTRSRRLNNFLVVGEVAMAMVLLAGAVFAAHTFAQQMRANPGFNPSRVLTLELVLPPSDYADNTKVNQFYDAVLERITRTPGVVAAAAVNPLPMNFELYGQEFQIEGKAGPEKREATRFTVTPAYFRAMQVPLLQGTTFSEQNGAGSPPVVVVNRRFAEQNWPQENAVGKQIRLLSEKGSARGATVVGVVGDSKDFLMHQALRPQIFLPQSQSPSRRRFLVVQAAGDPMTLASALRAEVEAVDRNVPITEIRRMEQVVFESMSPFFFAATILGTLGVGALLLAAMGIYGVISYVVRQRTHEIGVRMALGARRSEIMRLVLRQGARLAAIGLAIGLAASVGMMQVVRAALAGSAFDPLVLLGAPVLLAGIALLACYVPARRATEVDPMVALRYE